MASFLFHGFKFRVGSALLIFMAVTVVNFNTHAHAMDPAEEGKILAAQFGCFACHGENGVGHIFDIVV